MVLLTAASASKMKFLVVLLSLAALTRAQDTPQCECGAYITMVDKEVPVFSLPPTNLDDCVTDYAVCFERCSDEWNIFLADGSLFVPGPDGVPIGQYMCDTLKTQGITELGAHVVYLYYHVCDEGPWVYSGQYSHDNLCCTNGKYYSC